jgi:Protein of unknown function (DUF2723)
MKVSASVRPESIIAAAFIVAHLPSLSPTLEDIDSLNFALGLREFDPVSHQPHPPGYPVYIALGRISHAVVSRIPLSLDQLATEALALSIWSVIAGAVAIIATASFFRTALRLSAPTESAPTESRSDFTESVKSDRFSVPQ